MIANVNKWVARMGMIQEKNEGAVELEISPHLGVPGGGSQLCWQHCQGCGQYNQQVPLSSQGDSASETLRRLRLVAGPAVCTSLAGGASLSLLRSQRRQGLRRVG
jgi:hypothetical protein